MTPLTDSQRDLAGSPEALRMAQCAAAKFVRRHREQSRFDEYLSAAHLGLCHAAARFDPDRGFKFLTFAQSVVVGAMLDHRRVRMAHGFASTSAAVRRIKMAVVCSTADAIRGSDRGETIGNVIAADEPPAGWDLESEEEVRRLTRGLGSGGAAVRLLLLRADLGGAQVRVGEHMDLSESRVSQLVSQAVAEMRKRAGSDSTERFGLGLRDNEDQRSRSRAAKRRWRKRVRAREQPTEERDCDTDR